MKTGSGAKTEQVQTASVIPAQEPAVAHADSAPLQYLPIQRRLAAGAADDPLEAEADRMANTVMRMPAETFVQRKCAACEEEELQRKPLASSITPFIQAKGTGAGSMAGDAVSQQISSTRGGGSSMDRPTQSFMESRFGADFSHVKIHTGDYAVQLSRELSAAAFTVGSDIYFNEGRYNPGSESGKHLLAHELTHTIQQGSAAAIQRSWTILPRTTRNPLSAGGLTDQQLLENAFAEICPLTSRTGNTIHLGHGTPPASRAEGCDCLHDIDAAIGTPALPTNPTVQVQPDAWSSTATGPGIAVTVRHPDDPFSWGYWTGTSATHPTETRHIKPFWQTLAHEICGHGATFARSGGARMGSRSAPMGHNDAIIGENRVAAEHGVVPEEQRGLDFDPLTGAPMGGHRGESFLQAVITGFTHGSTALPATTAAVVSSVVRSVRTTSTTLGMDMLIQVEGRAFAGEGGATTAAARAAAVRAAITADLTAAGIALMVGGTARLFPDLAVVLPGSAAPASTSAARAVHVYLFHRPHSAGP